MGICSAVVLLLVSQPAKVGPGCFASPMRAPWRGFGGLTRENGGPGCLASPIRVLCRGFGGLGLVMEFMMLMAMLQ